MNIIVFPGQGSQKINMGKELYDNYSLVKNLFKEAEEISELPLTKIIFEGNEEQLKQTSISQVALMLISVATLRVLEEHCQKSIQQLASFVAGHSLGEYSALVASGALNFKDAVALLKVRGQAMEKSYPQGGAMLAVIGLNNIDSLKEIANKSSTNGYICEVANDNANGQIILSGNLEALEIAAKLAKEEYKAKITKFLDVSGPFHSSLMNSAVSILEDKLNTITFNSLDIPFISNVTAEKVTDVAQIKPLLLKQIISPVRWKESIIYAVNAGVTTLIEVGPNKVLTGLAKRIDNNLECVNIESIEDIKNVTF